MATTTYSSKCKSLGCEIDKGLIAEANKTLAAARKDFFEIKIVGAFTKVVDKFKLRDDMSEIQRELGQASMSLKELSEMIVNKYRLGLRMKALS